jgi:hypothetical protein
MAQRKRFRVHDAKMCDTLLSPKITPKNPDMLGSTVWQGLPAKSERPAEFDLSTSATPDDINGAESMAHEGPERTAAKLSITRDVARHAKGITPDDYNRINERFWSQQPQQPGRKFV